MKIAVDAMSGDFAPAEIVLGAVQAVQEYAVEVVLVGEQEKIQALLKEYGAETLTGISIRHASQVIEMCEKPAEAVRKKKDASVVVATQLVKEGVCDAVVAAGNTGAAVAAAMFHLGRIKGVERPSIATPLPNLTGTTVVLDSGANVDSKPRQLMQSAIMGSIYAEGVLHIQNPRVGLLNIGEEESKGNEQALATHALLKQVSSIRFIGNVEGRDIPMGTVDVVVCDGFVGNVVLKFGEGLASAIMHWVKDLVQKSSFLVRLAILPVLPAFKALRKRLDPAEYGGAPLLGVEGGVIICHGSSKALAIKNAVRAGNEFAKQKVVDHIRDIIAKERIVTHEGE